MVESPDELEEPEVGPGEALGPGTVAAGSGLKLGEPKPVGSVPGGGVGLRCARRCSVSMPRQSRRSCP